MKTATMILAAGFLSASAAAHAQSSINAQPPSGTQATGIDQAALLNSMTLMQGMNGPDLSLMLAEITAKLKAESSVTSQQLDAARANPASDSETLQAKLDALQRLNGREEPSPCRPMLEMGR